MGQRRWPGRDICRGSGLGFDCLFAGGMVRSSRWAAQRVCDRRYIPTGLGIFTKFIAALRMVVRQSAGPADQSATPVIPRAGGGAADMGTSGELIRLINYVDDIVTTLRRIQAFVPGMDGDESKRLAESLRAAGANLNAVVAQLEKGAK